MSMGPAVEEQFNLVLFVKINSKELLMDLIYLTEKPTKEKGIQLLLILHSSLLFPKQGLKNKKSLKIKCSAPSVTYKTVQI